jgi:antitoxin MazE
MVSFNDTKIPFLNESFTTSWIDRFFIFVYTLYKLLGGENLLQVQKWGNSLGIRIPKAIATRVGLEEGTEIDLDIEDDKIVIKRKSKNLDALLSQITPDNIHKEVSTGDVEGREEW